MFPPSSRLARTLISLASVAGVVGAARPALAASDISFVDLFRNVSYEQTGNGNALTLNGTFFSAELNTTVASPYTSASVTLPNSSSVALTLSSPTDYSYQTGLLPSVAAMNLAFPTGTYTFSGVSGGSTDTATASYTGNDFSQTLPYLTGTDYSSLQGMNAAQNFNFTLSTFTPGTNPAQSDAYIFLTVFNATTGTEVFTDGFLSDTTTSVILPGGTLTPGTAYSYELDYSDRDIVSGTGGQFPPELGFDVRTDGTFTTAAAAATTPEPSALALLGTGLVAGIGVVRRRLAQRP